MSSKSTWAVCETILNQKSQCICTSVPTRQDTSVQDTFPNRLLPSMLLCVFFFFSFLPTLFPPSLIMVAHGTE